MCAMIVISSLCKNGREYNKPCRALVLGIHGGYVYFMDRFN